MDGVDAAIFRISPAGGATSSNGRPKLSIEMLGHALYEIEPALRQKMKAMIGSGAATLEDVCRLDAAMGEVFAAAALKLMRSCAAVHVDLIGSHGQTIWHAPQQKIYGGISCANTMQLGQPAIIAERTGVPVVGDFRVQDMAAGGQGAPLVAFADEVLFGENGSGIGILNIGGIANITAIDDRGTAIMAFDTGPGNMLADRCCEKLFGVEYDDGGAIAQSGKLEQDWLNELLKLPYFEAKPPKTTGRELFGLSFADALIDRGSKLGLQKESILATVTALTPASIAQQYDRFIKPNVSINKIVLGGGGAENQFILDQLTKHWPHSLELKRHEDYGVSTKFKEALLFALLAYCSQFRIPNNVPACTGASRAVCMGKISNP
jgi:anhydro-N-acetylmuramic acid kinase